MSVKSYIETRLKSYTERNFLNACPECAKSFAKEYWEKHGWLECFRFLMRYKLPRIFKYNLSVVLTVKDESPYLVEFIEYYKLLGVDHFYIYNNNGTDNTPEILAPYIKSGLVTYQDFPGEKMQRIIYNHAIENYRMETRWMAIIDVDEFIVPLKDKNIPKFLRKYRKYPQVCIHWLLYGSAGHKTKTDGLVIERFNKHSASGNPHVKSIVNPRAVIKAVIHFHSVLGQSVNANFEEVTGPLDERAPIDKIRMNHYVIKSLEEYTNKQKRGRASGSKDDLNMGFFNCHDQNDVTDDYMQKYAKKISKKCKK